MRCHTDGLRAPPEHTKGCALCAPQGSFPSRAFREKGKGQLDQWLPPPRKRRPERDRRPTPPSRSRERSRHPPPHHPLPLPMRRSSSRTVSNSSPITTAGCSTRSATLSSPHSCRCRTRPWRPGTATCILPLTRRRCWISFQLRGRISGGPEPICSRLQMTAGRSR